MDDGAGPKPRRPGLKRAAVRAAGLAALAVSAVFLAGRLRSSWDAVAALEPGRAAATAGQAALAYGVLCLALGTGWRRLLQAASGRAVAWGTAHRMYARSQVAKYLPGNVLHFGGRHALGVAAGFAHGALAQAALLEAASLLLASAAVAAGGAAFFVHLPGRVSAVRLAALLLGAAAAPFALNAVARRADRLRRWGWRPLDTGALARDVLPALAVHAAFFLGAGLVLLGIVSRTAPGAAGGIAVTGRVLAAFALAWILGYVTPGAPAGLGVREAVLTAALAPALGDAAALESALLLRVATVMGDAVYFATSAAAR